MERVEKWQKMQVTPNDLVVYPDAASDAIVDYLNALQETPGPL